MEIVSKIALITINETLIVQVISFLIFLFILNRIMIRPLKRVMGDREKYIQDLKQEVVDAQKEMQQVTEELELKKMEARAEANKVKGGLEASGSQKASEIYSAARDEIAVLKEKVEAEIDGQISEVRKKFKDESEILAVNIMERILDRRIAS